MAPSMEDVLKQKDARIAKLECEKQRHVHELSLLRSVIGASRIKHNKEIYWLRLECDTVLQAKEAVEDRLAELLRGLRKMEPEEDDSYEEPPVCLDGSYVLNLRTQLEKAVQTVAILNNQISMVKGSYDEVVKSLKEEIGEVVEDKCRMEMELMNQLVTLDDEKRQLEASWHQDEPTARLSDETDSEDSGPEERGYDESISEDSFYEDSVCEADSISDISDEDKEEKDLQLLKKMVNLGVDKKKLNDDKDEAADDVTPFDRVNPIRTLLQINPNRNA